MSMAYSDNDRRRFKRLKINIEIAYKLNRPAYVRIFAGDKEGETITLDLSEAGVAILIDCDIPVSSFLMLEFMLYKVDKNNNFKLYRSIKVKGKVTSNTLFKNEHRLGINFIEIEKEDRATIDSFIKTAVTFQKQIPP